MKVLLLILRLPFAVIALVGMLLMLPLSFMVGLWWELLCLLLVPVPPLRFYLGRYLGAYPFSLTILLIVMFGSMMVELIWPGRGMPAFRRTLDKAVDLLSANERYVLMGGVWR